MNFWCSVSSLLVDSVMPKQMQIEQSNGPEEKKLGEVRAGKQQVSKMHIKYKCLVLIMFSTSYSV